MAADFENILEQAKAPDSETRMQKKSWLRRALGKREVILLLLNLGFILIISQLTPYFLYAGNNFANIRVMLIGMAVESVVMAAMVMLLVGGMFDLSVDGIVNMAGVMTGALLFQGANLWVAILVGFASAGVIGLVNGVAVTKLKMNPLMTTLGTWWIAQGIAYGVTQGIASSSFPDAFKSFGQGESILGIATPLVYPLIILPIAIWLLSKTRFGFHVYATGGNREAARLHGVKVDRVTIISFLLVALASALAGIVYAARLNAAVPQTVSGMNLRVIAGAVIGGCSLSGGEGSILGGLLGLFFMTMLTNASVVLGVSPYWQMCILGFVLLIAVAADAFAKRRSPST